MTKRYGILAYPAGHSLSPLIHNAAFEAGGIDARYEVFNVPESELADFMQRRDFDGLSVSTPYKEAVMEYLDGIDEEAKRIGAVNTVVRRDGVLCGYNVDFLGSNRALEEACGDLKGKSVAVIGAGGAAKSIVYGLLKCGANVEVFNRTAGKEVEGILSKSLGEIRGGDILVQASSALVEGVRVEGFKAVMDIIYKPRITPLLEEAGNAGKIIITGEKMLLYQGVEQFKIWTGMPAPIEVMYQALEQAF